MKGKYHVIVQNRYLKYEFDICRNLTMIRGDSATGKTTLVDMIRENTLGGRSSGVQISCDRPCRVLEGELWRETFTLFHDSILFIDEGNDFVESEEFAAAVNGSSNYFVIVTRENLDMLPISVTEVYGIKSSGKYGGLTQVYHEWFHIYSELSSEEGDQVVRPLTIITEDSHAGFEFFSHVASQYHICCISAEGKANIPALLQEKYEGTVLVIADGAAFAPQMNRLERVLRDKSICLYLPESFEWLVLNAETILKTNMISDVLREPWDYIESEKWISWERYFTYLLTECSGETYLKYTKRRLNPSFLQENIKNKILAVMKNISFDSRE